MKKENQNFKMPEVELDFDMQPKQMWNTFLKVKENYLKGIELAKSFIEEVETKENLGLKDEALEYKKKAIKMGFALKMLEEGMNQITMFIAKKEHITYFEGSELEKETYLPLYKLN